MRHGKDGYKLRRNPAHRRALLRNLTASVVEKNRVTTTLAKAKAVQPIVEKMVGLGKSGTLADKRRALAYFFKRQTVQKLFDEVAPRFMDRQRRLYARHPRRLPQGRRRRDGDHRVRRLYSSCPRKRKKKGKRSGQGMNRERA